MVVGLFTKSFTVFARTSCNSTATVCLRGCERATNSNCLDIDNYSLQAYKHHLQRGINASLHRTVVAKLEQRAQRTQRQFPNAGWLSADAVA